MTFAEVAARENAAARAAGWFANRMDDKKPTFAPKEPRADRAHPALSPLARAVLVAVAAHDGTATIDEARAAVPDVHPKSVTVKLSQLVAAGLIEKRGTVRRGGRSRSAMTAWGLTDAGREALA